MLCFLFHFRLLVFGVDCMNILFEIADRDLIIIGIIFLAILVVATIIFKVAIKGDRVKPISEDERFDNEDNLEEAMKQNVDTQVNDMTDEQKKAKEELERVYMQMSADLDKQEEQKDNIDEFEREQEENAIISYQELMAQAEKLKKQADQYEAHVESQTDMKVHEAMNTYNEHAHVESVKPMKKEEYHGFKNSDIISPIYGIQKDTKEKSSPKSQSNGIIGRAYEEINTESEKENNIDFLNSLKEFRRNL